MALFNKPSDINRIWATNSNLVVRPPEDKITRGWEVEIPPVQWFNWGERRQDQAIAHINQMGIPVWDSVTEYQANKSLVQGPTDGMIYRCLQTGVSQNPETDVNGVFWRQAFAGFGSGIGQGDADNRYTRRASNLSDLSSPSTARSNLDVLSSSQINSLVNSRVPLSDFNGSGRQLFNSDSGYQRLPGGLIIQWGRRSGGGDRNTNITWPIAFPTECLSAVATTISSFSIEADAGVGLLNQSRTGAVYRNGNANTASMTFIALGY